jgi:uncharacterized protein (TIGR02145 family)
MSNENLTIIVVTITGLLSNVVATWLEPSLSKFKRLIITLFVILCIYGGLYLKNSPKSEEVVTTNANSRELDTIAANIPTKSDTINKLKTEALLTSVKDMDNNVYRVNILADNKYWLCSNLNYNVANSFCYEYDESNCAKFGRLYTYEASVQACKSLGDGWHLPSKEEWIDMLRQYGTYDNKATIRNAGKYLVDNENVKFMSLLGGLRASGNNMFVRLNQDGGYWSYNSSNFSFFEVFTIKDEDVEINLRASDLAYSCRCIRNR